MLPFNPQEEAYLVAGFTQQADPADPLNQRPRGPLIPSVGVGVVVHTEMGAKRLSKRWTARPGNGPFGVGVWKLTYMGRAVSAEPVYEENNNNGTD